MADKLTLDKTAMRDKATAHLRIYVGNLTDHCTTEDIYECFSSYGKINGIAVNKGFGFVQFQDESSVQMAIQKADGIVLHGKSLNIRPAIANTTKPSEVIVIRPEVPPAVCLSSLDPYETYNEEAVYDKHGNFIGDKDEGGEDFPDSAFKGKVEGRGRGALRGRGRGRGEFRGRGGRGGVPGMPAFPDRTSRADWADKGFERFQTPPVRKLPVPERNDCEIIVVSRNLTEYAEYIEGRLHHLGIVVDLLYPMEDVPIGKVLGNIASRGCLYAILVMPSNQEHRSLTLTMLHGLPQEHRNMPLEDALKLIARNFEEVRRGGVTGREAVYALLGQLADGQTLTALQYDKVIEYLQERKEHQIKIELGEPLSASASKTQTDLQQRILSILNEKKDDKAQPPPPPPPAKEPLLNDPTVRKALDSILQKFI